MTTMSLEEMKRDRKQAEGFCLMWYACKCGHRERIWNSRDGVTAFAVNCPSCGGATLQHVDWQFDTFAPSHKPHRDQRVWVWPIAEAVDKGLDEYIAAVEAKNGIVAPPGVKDRLRADWMRSPHLGRWEDVKDWPNTAPPIPEPQEPR